jgi:replicative DNA helicase
MSEILLDAGPPDGVEDDPLGAQMASTNGDGPDVDVGWPIEEPVQPVSKSSARAGLIDGADWLENVSAVPPALWGRGPAVVWAENEPVMLYGPDGVGKTSIAQQLVLHQLGVRLDPLLGLPVTRTERRILYLALDRPAQAQRSIARMIDDEQREQLRGRLLIWRGPLPFSVLTQPAALLEFAQQHDVGTVIVDSLKDYAVDLVKDETGTRVNLSFQHVVANGIQLGVCHHPRKDPAGTPTRPKTLEDVYGSRWITAGMGSIVLVWGKAGDLVVDVSHLKQPAEAFGPVKALHDHVHGRTTPYTTTTIEEQLERSSTGITVADAARTLFTTDAPDDKERERARRTLERLVKDNVAERRDDPDGTARYRHHTGATA